ncbi:MAG: HAD family hydrolase [Alphaproteobacteria bacterium]
MIASPPAGRPVELVIFDCDGVLIDSEVISTRSTVAALAMLGYRVSEEDGFRRFVGKSYASIRLDIQQDWGQSLPASFEADVERRTLDAMAIDLQPVDGTDEALSNLALPRCVASSSSVDWITSGLLRTGLLAHFAPHLFSASMVEHGKPAPDIFLHAAESMGTAPARAVVIEDSLPGVRAGVAAGMTVIGFTGGSHIIDKADHGARLKDLGAAHVIDDMRLLPDLVAT